MSFLNFVSRTLALMAVVLVGFMGYKIYPVAWVAYSGGHIFFFLFLLAVYFTLLTLVIVAAKRKWYPKVDKVDFDI